MHTLQPTKNPNELIKQIQQIIEPIITKQAQWGIDLQLDKCEILLGIHGKGSRQLKKAVIPAIRDKSLPIKFVEETKYLGTRIGTSVTTTHNAVNERIKLANGAISKLRSVWSQQHITISTKINLYQALITSVLLYSMESHQLLESDILRIESVQTRHLRRIGESPAFLYHESNLNPRERLQVHSIASKIRLSRLSNWHSIFKDKTMTAVQGALLGKWAGEQETLYSPNKRLEAFRQDLTDLYTQISLKESITGDFNFDRNGNVKLNKGTWEWFLALSKQALKSVLAFESYVEPRSRVKEGPRPSPEVQCPQCPKKFETNAAMSTHRRIVHKHVTIERRLVNDKQCLICKNTFASNHSAKNHAQRVCLPKLSPELRTQFIQQIQSNINT